MISNTGWAPVKLGSLGEFRNGVNFSKDKKGQGLGLINVKDIFLTFLLSISIPLIK